jgi:hypothetical protein
MLVTWKKAAAFIVISRRKKSCRKAAEKPLNGQKAVQRTKQNNQR